MQLKSGTTVRYKMEFVLKANKTTVTIKVDRYDYSVLMLKML